MLSFKKIIINPTFIHTFNEYLLTADDVLEARNKGAIRQTMDPVLTRSREEEQAAE